MAPTFVPRAIANQPWTPLVLASVLAGLAAVTGSGNIARSEVVSKMWDYIKKNNLQNPENKREIMADDKLKPIFGGKDKVSMFEMNKHLSNHPSNP